MYNPNLNSSAPLARVLPFLSGRQILLLQGPIGPFFKRLAHALQDNGNTVSKINFNGGDWVYFRDGESFKGHKSELATHLRDIMRDRKIDMVLMFSDCRPIHVIACDVARDLNIEIGVFEEGYIRPNHLTCERGGVNAYSQADLLTDLTESEIAQAHKCIPIGNTFPNKACSAFFYFLFGILGRPFFPKYRHHKSFIPRQLIWWLRSGIRKQLVKPNDSRFMRKLESGNLGTYYLVALQVYDDFQIVTHSDYNDVRDFIADVISSFAQNAPPHTQLVFKHHPMDRGYRQYGALIADLTCGTATEGRVHYHHEIELLSVIDQAAGTIVVNSTVGLEALSRGCPTCVIGSAFYKLPDLVFDGKLDDFWKNTRTAVPDPQVVKKFRNNVLFKTQINGSFYKALPDTLDDAIKFSGLAFHEPKT